MISWDPMMMVMTTLISVWMVSDSQAFLSSRLIPDTQNAPGRRSFVRDVP